MGPLRSFGVLFSITLFRVVVVVQSSKAFVDLPDRVPRRVGNATHYRMPGEHCSANDVKWYPMEEDPRKFLYCDRRTRKLVADMCASVNNVAKIFDERFQRCVMPALGKQRTPGVPKSSTFGQPCMYNTDCLDNMYCPNGICLCVAGYIDSVSACVPAVGPGQSRCASDQECRAAWPTTNCTAGRCTCVLPPDLDATPATHTSTQYQTTEGLVCLICAVAAPGRCFCPLPVPYDAATVGQWNANTAGPAMFDATAATGVTCAAAGGPCTLNGVDWSDMAICVPLTGTTAVPATFGCCPNRAHTCMQPRPAAITPAAGAAATGETRYWYNQATASCETFFWDGLNPYANNFKTREHCMTYCGGICPRGYTVVSNNGVAQTCGTTANCGSTTLTCQNVASAGRQLCCPTQASICSATGGRSTAVAAAAPAATGVAAAPQAASVVLTRNDRYQYDPATRTCVLITGGYTGWGGTYNNFGTMQECTTFCISSACERGEPLKTANGLNQPCGRGCPTTYECRSNICCPRRQTVCIEPKLPGSCTQSVLRYWYNAATRDCEQFTYTGCGGNDNNFESYQACVTFCREVKPEPQCIQGSADKDSAGNYYTCTASGVASTCRPNYECYFDGYSFGCCPQRAYTCSLSRQTGSACVAPTSRWYYDTTTRSCQTFTYGGCDGNSNNFINRQECERYCGVGGCPYGGEPYREASGAIRVCNAQVTCPTGHSCNTVGVGGSTLNYCCQTRAYICQQSPVQGSQCTSQLQRYYFNIATRQCATFTYFGCGGNENNFATLSQCNNFCGSAACLAGEAAYIDPNSNRPLTCNPAASGACPQGYSCRSDTLLNNNVCCGSNDMGVCPTGERAYIEALTMSVRECQPGVASSCPNIYLCRPNSSRNRYFCCATAAANICPAGKAVYRSPDTNQPLACFVSTINQCPQDYSCQPTTTAQLQGYCCTINTLCPNAGDFFVETTTQQPRRCTVQVGGFNPCPTTYTCASNNVLTPTVGYCCRGGGASLCSTGVPNLINGVPMRCIPNQAPFCPANFACALASTGGGVYYCCSTTGTTGCPAGTNAFIPAGSVTPQLCVGPADTTCPSGYSCQLSPTLSRYQCCGGGVQADGCPIGMVAYREPGTNVIRTCTFGGSQCPSPYSCQTATGGRQQCCGLSGGCPSPMVAAINPTTGQPLLCTAGAVCPNNFQCLQATTGQLTCCGTGTVGVPTRARCPYAGQTVYIVPGSGQAQTCRVGVQTCPAGYQCLNGGDGFVCCTQRQVGGGGTNLAGACPFGSSVYVNPVTRQAQSCANSFVRCPLPYRCQYSASLRNYYCCSVVTTGVVNTGVVGTDENAFTQPNGGCPSGEAPFFPNGSSVPAECDKDKSPCPSGYSCNKRTDSEKSMCCRPLATAAPEKAPDGGQLNAAVEEEEGGSDSENGRCWGRCTPGVANNCIRGYACQTFGTQSMCCRTTAAAQTPDARQPAPQLPAVSSASGGCPSGRPFMYPGTQLPLTCQPSRASTGTGTCPVGYRCTTTSGRNLCCPSSGWK